MHYHPGADSFWMVLQGGALLQHGRVIGEYGPHEVW